MDITLLPPSTILSHHSHLSLLSSPFPCHYSSHPVKPLYQPHIPFSSYSAGPSRTSSHMHRPPRNGSSPITTLPGDLLLECLSYLHFTSLLPLQRTSRQFQRLCLHPSLHHTLSIHTLPPLPLPNSLIHLLQSVKNLTIHLSPYNHPYSSSTSSTRDTIHAILAAIPENQLHTLNLPFSSPFLSYPDLATQLRRIGGKLVKLDLRGSAINGSTWVEWFNEIGRDGPGLLELNLSFTSISDLPIHNEEAPEHISTKIRTDPFRNLRSLSLSSCSSLSGSTLPNLLKHLPITIETLDLSRLDQIPYTALADLRVVSQGGVTALREIRLVGIDHLTRMDIRGLKRCWDGTRAEWLDEQREDDCMGVDVGRKFGSMPISPVAIPLGRNSPTAIMSMGILTPPTTPPRSVTLNGYRQTKDLHDRYAPYTPKDDSDISIDIIHSAILESEDEAGYRQFIGEVVEGTLSYGIDRRRGLSSFTEWEEVTGGVAGGYIEIDQGGYISP